MADIRGPLQAALSKLRAEKSRLTKQIEAIEGILRRHGGTAESRPRIKRRRKMTGAERRAVSRRMKAYWTKRKRGSRRRKARAA